jgi:hypothetical protein
MRLFFDGFFNQFFFVAAALGWSFSDKRSREIHPIVQGVFPLPLLVHNFFVVIEISMLLMQRFR